VLLVFITVMVVIKESAMAYFVEVDGEVCVKNGTKPCGETVRLSRLAFLALAAPI
jgi:hypothetical protein